MRQDGKTRGSTRNGYKKKFLGEHSHGRVQILILNWDEGLL